VGSVAVGSVAVGNVAVGSVAVGNVRGTVASVSNLNFKNFFFFLLKRKRNPGV
jgi:hypothetical protein